MEKGDVEALFAPPEEGVRVSKLAEVTKRLRCIAHVDPRTMFDKRGQMISPTQWSEEFAVAVKTVRPANAGGYDVTFHDANRAMDQLAKYEGMLEDEDKSATPLDALFVKCQRTDLVKLKDLLDTMARAEAEVAVA